MMKNYARIEIGRVAEVILGVAYNVDAPVFLPQPVFDEAGAQIGVTPQPADWPAFTKGEEVPIETRFTPSFVATLVDISDFPGVEVGDTYDGSSFHPYEAPQPSATEILARNTATRDTLLSIATTRIAPLQDASDLEMATALEVAALKSWKAYRVAVNRVDLSAASPVWPAQPT